MSDWIKLHTDLLDNPDLASITPTDYMIFTFLLMLARRQGNADGVLAGWPVNRLAWRFRQTTEQVEASLQALRAVGWVTVEDDTVTIPNFVARQYDKPSDAPPSTRARQQKRRSTEDAPATDDDAEATVTPLSRDCHADVTPLSRDCHAPVTPCHAIEENRIEESREEKSVDDDARDMRVTNDLPPQPDDPAEVALAPPGQAIILGELSDIGITAAQGVDLLRTTSADNIRAWIAYAKKQPGLTSIAGFVVKNARTNCVPPAPVPRRYGKTASRESRYDEAALRSARAREPEGPWERPADLM
jgi:hypothetical protein